MNNQSRLHHMELAMNLMDSLFGAASRFQWLDIRDSCYSLHNDLFEALLELHMEYEQECSKAEAILQRLDAVKTRGKLYG